MVHTKTLPVEFEYSDEIYRTKRILETNLFPSNILEM